ncbi:SAM-dependent methyltransferase [Arcobacteraceae bacterium]|nr:SAM-dependent methyltransferase [Arcobacteraceae bacterium]
MKSDSLFKDADIFDKHESIKLRERSFEQIVKELEIYNLTSTSADVKGIAFEKFLGRTFRGELGQFFTPRVIIYFIVNLLDPKEDELICDRCAGSGGFLIKTFETIKNTIEKEFFDIKKAKQKELFGEELENIEDEDLNKQYEEVTEYENIKDETQEEIESKYFNEIDPIEEQLKLRAKEAPKAEDKKILKAKLKEIVKKRDDEIKEIVKEKFDYEIPISDIKKAGITTTGAVGKNQLPELLELFT